MSVLHFQALQQMIELLEAHGYKDVTDEVKPLYDTYFHLCTLLPPASEEEQGHVICDSVQELIELVEQVDPSRLRQQIWWCERCQVVGAIRYRKGAGPGEVVEALGRDHRSGSPNCPTTAYWLRVINTTVIVSQEALVADKSIPAWAVHPVSQFLGFQTLSSSPEGKNV